MLTGPQKVLLVIACTCFRLGQIWAWSPLLQKTLGCMLSEGKEEIFLLYATDVILLKPVEKVAGKRQPHSSWEGAEADETLSFFHLPSYFYVPLWRRPRSAEQMWMKLWWKGNSNRVNPYSFTHRDHPLLVPGSVGRESDLWHSSEAFLLLLFFLLLFLQPCQISQPDWQRPQKKTHMGDTLPSHGHLCMNC